MVADRQWGQFQKPSDINKPKQQEEGIPLTNQASFEEEEKPKPEQKQWGQFENPNTYQGPIDPTEGEGTLDYFTRNIAANASRLGEQIFGRYGNIEKISKSILSDLPESTGVLGWAISELIGPENWERMVKGVPGKEQMLPTSEQLKEFSQEVTKGYTKPKTEGEKKFQGVVEDVGSTISGNRAANVRQAARQNILNPNQARIAANRASAREIAVNNLGIPAAANVVEKIVDDLGFGKDKSTIAKLGIWKGLSLLGNINAEQYASQLMNNGRNGIPVAVNVNIPRLQNRLQQVANHPDLLHADPRSALARQQLDAIARDMANGQNSTRSFMTTYDGINAAKRSRGLFEFGRNDREFARNAINRVRDAVRDEIMDSGANHPEALNNWRSGLQAWAVIHTSRTMTNWVRDLANGPYAKILSGPAAALFGVSSYGAIKAPLVALPTSAALPAAYKVGQTAYRVWNDPNLANYYWHALYEANRENAPAFINNLNKLNKGLEKSEPTKKKSKSKEK